MAENEDGQEKTEQPTAKRLEESRRKGQVARSRELNTMAVTLAGGIALTALSGHMGSGLSGIMSSNFRIDRADLFDTSAMLRHLAEAIGDALLMLLPFFAVVAVVAVLSSVALGGFSISAESMVPKFSKLNPVKGLGRLFSVKGLMELAKAMAKFLLIAGATGLVLWNLLDEFIGLGVMELGPAVAELVTLIGGSFVLIASTLILIALADVPFQLWDHKRQLKMTKQEVREELKQTEGRPEVKGRIRSLQREMAQRRMMEEVPKADVVVTNPTHYAVALRYDQDSMAAPKVVAKGADLVAANIRRVAGDHGVPVVEAPMLARAIHAHSEIGDAIPAGLYLAVAKLLAYVFQLRAYREGVGARPQPPTDLPVPEEMQVPADDGDTPLH
ncbi:MAG TPA: flagellar type III secretion system protein FlhB [Sedimenticola thiotaurini]|uniref:Flagellar biosynthetic protein FlhB n=1 Tax=Sedimenticola thiotaurini TaxID=1543721 RepID=A0A831RL79_9GAMM|nr:flagellar type III secretion system protein FlhB [Sedimenticola thiotaurini]